MGIRFMDKVAQDIIKKGEIKLTDNCITGSKFEKWLYDDEIILSREASLNLLKQLHNPDKEALEKRDEYLASVNQTAIKNEDGSITLICPDLDLSDIGNQT